MTHLLKEKQMLLKFNINLMGEKKHLLKKIKTLCKTKGHKKHYKRC